MKKDATGKNLVRKRIIIILALALLDFLLGLFEDHPNLVERYYTEGVYRVICRVFHPILNLFPFSLGDVIYLGVIGLIIYSFFRLIVLAFKKQFKQVGILLLGMIISVQSMVVAFYLLWGINYYRPSAAERLNLPDSNYTTTQLVALTKVVIDSANITRARLTPAELKQDDKTIAKTAIRAVLVLSGRSKDFLTYSPHVKSSLFTPIINYLGTSGYYNPFTTEAQVNYAMPVFLKPFVDCHEMSHQIGYGPEDEANFVGFLAGIKSNDPLLQYSAWHEAVEECMRDLMMRDTVLHGQMRLLVSPAVHDDFIAERDFWVAYENKIDEISSIFYDSFLKANNQPQGMETYNRMVRLVMALYNKQLMKH
jgi:hypothetical protein